MKELVETQRIQKFDERISKKKKKIPFISRIKIQLEQPSRLLNLM